MKTPIQINFSAGLNTKADPFQIPIGQFQALENSIFTKQGMLQKRSGYGQISTLPTNTTYSYLTTLNDNLTAVGPNIAAFNPSNNAWVTKGTIQPCSLSVLPLIRNSVNQNQCDAAVAANGLICTVYTETTGGSTSFKYAIANSTTGQNIVQPTVISGATATPRVFLLSNYFVIAFTDSSALKYFSISSINTSLITSAQNIASSYVAATTVSWDGVVFNNALYVGYNTTSGGQAVKVAYLNAGNVALAQAPSASITFSSAVATMMSLCADASNSYVYVSYYDASGSTAYTAAISPTPIGSALEQIFAPVETLSSGTMLNITSAAQGGSCTVFFENQNGSAYHYLETVVVTAAGSAGSPTIIVRSVGLGSKAFIVNGAIYVLASFSSTYQSTYFLIPATSTQSAPQVIAKLAYENGGGYLTKGLPGVTISGNQVQIPYLYKDLIEPLATQNTTTQTTTGGIYAQTGINLVTFNLGLENTTTVEIANGLQLGGGFGWLYDGYLPVEQNFFLWPEPVSVTNASSGGTLAADTYYYQAVYEWSDNFGNVHRSAPSIPVSITVTGSTNVNTIVVTTLRLTYKVVNKVKITLYRWSTASPAYYQYTSISTPTLNSTTSDSVSIVDDGTLVASNFIYTTGGVVEDVNPPSTQIMTIFDTRVWLVNAEDPNQLWYSKQIIEATPVEWSDLFTFYVAPNTGTVSTTGPVTALAPMDDKLIIFKQNAMYYINGTGPDNTGNPNPAYNGPIFITSTVGCVDTNSIVLMPKGLMFQSNKGIWLLGRDGVTTEYIGAPVEAYNSSAVNSAVSVPTTNQVRQTLSTGQTLMYDYFFSQWGTFNGVPATSSCVYQNLHSFINQYGQVYQETPGSYVDGTNPVLLGFTTGWINVAGLQGFERAYYLYLLGRFLSPCQIQVQIAYDYNDSPVQSSIIHPNNFSSSVPSPYGDQPAPFGSPSDVLPWVVHFKKQKCSAFKIILSEIYDPSYGTIPGAGFTLSAITLYALVKSAKQPRRAANTVG